MALWMVVIPLVISMTMALVMHSLIDRFWLACCRSGLVFALVMLAWVMTFQLIFGPAPDFARRLLLTVGYDLLVAAMYGIVGFLVAVIVGIPFYLDRLIQKRDEQS